jgi:hypothetical protein
MNVYPTVETMDALRLSAVRSIPPHRNAADIVFLNICNSTLPVTICNIHQLDM